MSAADYILTEALAAAARGWRVHPLRGKVPILTRWETVASADPAMITEWLAGTGMNYGLATGAESGFVVLDVDAAKGDESDEAAVSGEDSLAALVAEHGPLPPTVEVATGGGGRHFYFVAPAGGLRNSESKLAPGIDVKADRGQVVGVGSVHPDTGALYEWKAAPDETPIAPMPGWLLELLRALPAKTSKAASATTTGGEIITGARNGTLLALAGRLRASGMAEAMIEMTLQGVNVAQCKPPLDASEVAAIAARYARGGGSPASAPLVASAGPDGGNAAALAELTSILALDAIGRRVTGARLIGRGSTASADIFTCDGTAIEFERFADMATPAKLSTEVAATVGAAPALKQPLALRAMVLVRQVAQKQEGLSMDEQAREWASSYLQEAEVIAADMRDQAARWATFGDLSERGRLHDRARPQVVVVEHTDGTRYIRTRWFADYARLMEPSLRYELAATRMLRIGWSRTGQHGRIKATSPFDGRTIVFNFMTVPAGWSA